MLVLNLNSSSQTAMLNHIIELTNVRPNTGDLMKDRENKLNRLTSKFSHGLKVSLFFWKCYY
jgi:hypothetical protein